ncbi:MAG: hypothetical protein AAGI27_15200 [Pseudomonadota bacterium]
MTRIGVLFAALFLAVSVNANETRDVFEGKLFPPNVVLEYREELKLTKAQYTEIRAAVVSVQAEVAEHEWDMQEAYSRVMNLLDKRPLDESLVTREVTAVLQAENKVKLAQMTMLVRIRNLLDEEQVAFLEANWSQKDD